jgi:hypothetical protein
VHRRLVRARAVQLHQVACGTCAHASVMQPGHAGAAQLLREMRKGS